MISCSSRGKASLWCFCYSTISGRLIRLQKKKLQINASCSFSIWFVDLIRWSNLNLLTVCCFQCRYFTAFLAYGGCNLVLATTAAAICAYIAPAAAGSGIPEVKAYLNGVDAYSILAPSTLFVKVRFKLRITYMHSQVRFLIFQVYLHYLFFSVSLYCWIV